MADLKSGKKSQNSNQKSPFDWDGLGKRIILALQITHALLQVFGDFWT